MGLSSAGIVAGVGPRGCESWPSVAHGALAWLEQIAHIGRFDIFDGIGPERRLSGIVFVLRHMPNRTMQGRWPEGSRHRGETLTQGDLCGTLGIAPRIAIADILRHPRLPEARKVYLDRFLDVYDGDPFLVRLLIESGRFLVYMITIVLEAASDPESRDTWLTVGLLKRTMGMFGMASGRHVDHLIARLCAVGFMQSRPSEHDRRVRILSPTDKLRAHDRAWLAAHYAPLAVLYPHHDYGMVMRGDPEFQVLHRRLAVAVLPVAARLYLSEPDMLLFLNRAGGYMVIAALLKAAMDAGDRRHTALPYADIGDRFGVSRTHVRKLVVDAERAGLVKLHGHGGRGVEILPRLWESHDRGIACGMYLNDMVYAAAMQSRVSRESASCRARP